MADRRKRVRIAVFAVALVCFVAFLVYRSLYRPLFVEPQRPIRASLVIERLGGEPGKIFKICVTNHNDWTWPVAEIIINDRYELVVQDFEPGKTQCCEPWFFTVARSQSRLKDDAKINVCRIIIKTHGFLDQILGVWEASSFSQALYLGMGTGLAVSPTGKWLCVGVERQVMLVDTGSLKLAGLFARHLRPVRSIAFSSNGRLLALGADDGTIKLLDVPSMTEVGTLRGHVGIVHAVAFSPSGDSVLLVSVSDDATVRVWDVQARRELATLHRHEKGSAYTAVAFSQDGKLVAAGSGDGTVRVWDIEREQVAYSIQEHKGTVNSVAFSPDGMILATGFADGSVVVWSLSEGAVLARLSGHKGAVNAVQFFPLGRLLVSGAEDGDLKVWDVGTGTELFAFSWRQKPVRSVVVSQDGRVLASRSSDGTVLLWDVKAVLGRR